MRIKGWVLFTVLIMSIVTLSACQPKISTEAELGEAFQTALDEVVNENDNIHNAVLKVQGPEF